MSEPQSSAKEIVCNLGDDAFNFQKIEFEDKIVLNVLINGVMDTTFDLPLSTQSTINPSTQQEDLGVEPVVLVGDPHNIKLQVIAGQIGKLVQQLRNPRNVILTIGSRYFGRGDVSEGDFDKLMFVLDQVKQLIEL